MKHGLQIENFPLIFYKKKFVNFSGIRGCGAPLPGHPTRRLHLEALPRCRSIPLSRKITVDAIVFSHFSCLLSKNLSVIQLC